MAQEYLLAKNKNHLGQIALSKSVFETIAKIAVDEEDVLALADTISPFKSSLNCKILEDRLMISLEVKVKYHANVEEACSRLQGKIYESILHMTDYATDEIDVKIVGFLFE